MSRHTGPKCRLCRREGMKLFLKGTRCYTAKCPIEKRAKPPGMHGWRRARLSPYGLRLREKQKVKRFYGLNEAQFRRFFDKASRMPGHTGDSLLSLLERRLDNVLKVSGLALSRAGARQMIRHGHIQVNNQKVDIPSYMLKEGDVVRPEPKDKILGMARADREALGHPQPAWLSINEADLTVRAVRLPVREDISAEVDVGLIVEFASR